MSSDFTLTPVQKKLDGSKEDEYRELEKTLWGAADKLRSNMDAAEYKHVVLGLIFLKYVSDSFNRVYKKIMKIEFADPEDPDEYRAENVFWVPKEGRWENLQKRAKEHEVIGQLIDQSMDAIERDNPKLRGVLPRNYARPELDKQRLGELIDLISGIGFGQSREQGLDLLGRVYEYFIGEFADAEGKKGGQFYTPRCIVRLLVEMIEPFEGRVFDPCCGSGGMFIQSRSFVEAHQGRVDAISIYGQESNPTTWRLCMMNLAIRGIEGVIKWGDSFTDDQHKDLKADFILANPPFNMKEWRGEQLRKDTRWKYGIPPNRNANFAWIQHFIHHLSQNGVAGFVMSKSALSSETKGEDVIRKNIVNAGIIDCIVELPSQLFYNTQIPASLWFIRKGKKQSKSKRKDYTLFIDASQLGTMIDGSHKTLTKEDILLISNIYHKWLNDEEWNDVIGFYRSASLNDIKFCKYNLSARRYVGYKEDFMDLVDTKKAIIEDMEKITELISCSTDLYKKLIDNLDVNSP